MEQQADLTWLRSRAALPLTLLPQWAGAAAANAGCIHHAQTPIGFSALLVDTQGLPGRTTQRAIWLRGKVATREAASFPGQGLYGRSIALCRGRGRGSLLQRRSKFGRAHRDRLKLMAQLQTHVPYPLADDLPCPPFPRPSDYTSDPDPAPRLRPRGRFQMRRDASKGPLHPPP